MNLFRFLGSLLWMVVMTALLGGLLGVFAGAFAAAAWSVFQLIA